MAYAGVLWIELGPAFLEKWESTSKNSALVGFAKAGLKFYDKALIWIIALGVLLPTMHQSSLGTLMLLAGNKLHGLWYTPWVPLLFLISCVGMGYAVVVWESSLSAKLFKREREDEMLISLSGAMVVVLRLSPASLRRPDHQRQGAFDVHLGVAEHRFLGRDRALRDSALHSDEQAAAGRTSRSCSGRRF